MGESRALDDWIGRFVQAALAEAALDRFVALVDEVILDSLPQVAADAMLVDDLHRSTRHQWLAFLAALRRADHELVLPPQAADLARSLARRGHEVGVLLRVYLSAHHGVFAYLGELIDALGREEHVPEEMLRVVWRRADLWMDESLETLIEVFIVERQREQDGRALRSGELIEALVSGAEVDPTLIRRDLAHPLHLWQTTFIAWTTGTVDLDTRAVLQVTAQEVARQYEGAVLLTHLAGSRDLWCWLATPRPPEDVALHDVERSLAPDVAIALGTPGEGVEGFRSSYLDARAVQQLVMASPYAPRIVDYRDVELLCLAMGEPQGLARLVRREIAPLCDPGKNLAPVRVTVLAYLTHRMNVEETAERLFVHRNTVRYRLAKAEELLGRPLSDRPRHIALALQYVSFLGAPSPG